MALKYIQLIDNKKDREQATLKKLKIVNCFIG